MTTLPWSHRQECPADNSIWVEVENGHWPLDTVRVWDTYPDIGKTEEDLTPNSSFYRGVVAFEIIEGRNGPKENEQRPERCRRIWPLASFLRDFRLVATP